MTDRPPADLAAVARDELAPGEMVEWAAQPDARRVALTGFAVWLFAIPWTAFSLFWTAMASLTVEDWTSLSVAFPLFGVPFIAIGLAMLSTPWWAWRGARRTLYAVTDRRAILFEASGLRAITVRSFRPEALRDVRRTERPDGSGSLVFAQTEGRDADGDRTRTTVGFANVRDVRAAEGAVQALASLSDDGSAAVDEPLQERSERRRERL
ncbi:MAG TPA: hypothetical protein VF594_05990 [Rubricoccaceae bacterium]